MSAGATASDSPYIQGRNARVGGKTRDSCPYPDGSEDRAGWLQAYDKFGPDEETAGADRAASETAKDT